MEPHDAHNDNSPEMRMPTLNELKACQFSNWYPKFRSLNNSSNRSENDPFYPHNNITIRSIVISPLSPEFIDYLKSDGVVLPKGAQEVSSFLPTDTKDCWSSDEEDENDDGDENVDHNSTEEVYFPQLNQEIKNALDSLGPCMPKLNWSAPKDVTWLNESTLKCSTVGDVYLLLKSSDFVLHDLEHALDGINVGADIDVDERKWQNEQFELILRKWSNLHASMEFRCFVSKHELVGICQRNHTQHYPFLKKEYMQLRSHIIDFYDTYIYRTFADGEIEDFAFDIYIDKNERIWLLDFGLWSKRTDALMFTWEELSKYSADEAFACKGTSSDDIELVENTRPVMRVVMNENEVHYDPLASYRAPIDTVNLASTEEDSLNWKNFMAMCSKPSDHED